MAHSLCQLAVHIIFGLKRHGRYLNDSFYPYINGIITNQNGHSVAINGTEDHIHILCYLPRDMSIADFVRTIKSNSSKWFNAQGKGRMQWQEGYAAFSVSHTNIPFVKKYIENQKEHHKTCTFESEMKTYFAKLGQADIGEDWFQDE